jgi:hypothetical protein
MNNIVVAATIGENQERKDATGWHYSAPSSRPKLLRRFLYNRSFIRLVQGRLIDNCFHRINNLSDMSVAVVV